LVWGEREKGIFKLKNKIIIFMKRGDEQIKKLRILEGR